ncbi:adenylyltransferase/cytidyltransferase family protein [Sporosarcina globispora]|nr:adenylyltransferase/cytidyltransferase family protein [Sporosarcina globispora]
MTVGFIGGKFLPLHLGHVYAIVHASAIVDEL